MKIKIYDKFVELSEKHILSLKRFKIALCRTYLFKNKKGITFRKYFMPRRMFVLGKSKEFRCKNIEFPENLNKYKISRIDKFLIEYVASPNKFGINQIDDFDVAIKRNKRVSSINFDGKKNKNYSNMLWINEYNYSFNSLT